MKPRLDYRPFKSVAAAPVESSGSAKTRKIRVISRSPEQAARKAWSTAISRVDAHSLACKSCHCKRFDPGFAVAMGSLTDPKLDPYQPCKKAVVLETAERQAMQAYIASGGKLPCNS